MTNPRRPKAVKPFKDSDNHHWFTEGNFKHIIICSSCLFGLAILLFAFLIASPFVSKIIHDLSAKELLAELVTFKDFLGGGGIGLGAGITIGITVTNIWHKICK